jgi:hypothetical protein
MGKTAVAFTIGMGTVSLAAGVIVAKAQIDSSIWYAWILKNAFVVPGLLFFAVAMFFIALRECGHFRRISWVLFAWLVPPHKSSRKVAPMVTHADIDGILDDGDRLKNDVPKLGSLSGADSLWRNAEAAWQDRAIQLISRYRPSDLPKFTAFLNPSNLKVDREVFSPLQSHHAVFSRRLDLLRELLAPEQRIVALKHELKAEQAQVQCLKHGLELVSRRKLTHSMLRTFLSLLADLRNLGSTYQFDNETFKPLSSVAVPPIEEPTKWKPRDFSLSAFQIRYCQYLSVFRNCGFTIQNPDPPHENVAPPPFGPDGDYSEVYEQLNHHARALQSYAASLDKEAGKLTSF